MGTFIGHVVPGSFFMLAGLWWLVHACRRVLRTQDSRRKFRSSVSLAEPLGRWRLDPEAVFILFSTCAGLMIELRGVYIPSEPLQPHHAQHATMYFFFGVLGLLGLLSSWLKLHVPELEGIKYLTLSLCFATEALLFHYHLFGRNIIDTTVHELLINTAWLCGACCLLELWRRESVILVLCRAFLTFLQGTWFWQVAFILYNPAQDAEPWDPNNHHHVMLISCIYTWHVAAGLVLFLVLAVILSYCHRKQSCCDEPLELESMDGYEKLLTDAPE